KSSAASELIRAIQMALKAKSYVTPQIARGMQKVFINNPQPRVRAKALTPRQREVVQLLAEGKSMKEVADVLNVTPRTVAFHKYRIVEDRYRKTTAELIPFAIKSGILVTWSTPSDLIPSSAVLHLLSKTCRATTFQEICHFCQLGPKQRASRRMQAFR